MKKHISDDKRLIKEWDWEKNNEIGLDPNVLTLGSKQNAYWLCEKGHSFYSRISHRANGSNCPYCYGRKAIVGETDLATTNPTLASEWHPTKNGDLTPKDVKANSNNRVWWKCSTCGNEWISDINSRNQGNGCPYCSGHKATPGKNDLATTNPSLAAEWHPTKNEDIYPSNYLPFSMKRVWWLCSKCGYEWEETINSRSHGKKCPNCIIIEKEKEKERIKHNSFGTKHPEFVEEWHPAKNKSLTPYSINDNYKKRIWWICGNGHEFLASIKTRLAFPLCPICNKKPRKVVNFLSNNQNSLFLTNPQLASEWHPTKNGDLTPRDVMPNSNKKAWWLCPKCGHEWNTMIQSRNKGAGCPNCSRNKIRLRGKSLEEAYPQIASEWHPTKNGDLKPNEIGCGSTKSVWWLCSNGHNYKTPIDHRVYNHAGCPYCSNSKVLYGFNDLESMFPEIASEWHPTKNGDLAPKSVLYGSSKKVWWLCKNGHSYQSIVKERTSIHKRGCPYCAGQKAIIGVNDLLTINPQLASEWHPTKNGDLTPRDVMPMSNKKVWWLCKYNHEWQAKVNKRSIGEGCPICQTFNRTSMPEFTIYYYVRKYFKDSINGFKASFLGTTEIDIYIPSIKVGIEYDGIWHKKERDISKDEMCQNQGVKLIRVRSNKIEQYQREDPTFVINQDDLSEMTSVIKQILVLLGIELNPNDIDVSRDYSSIFEEYHSIKISNNLAEKYPKLALEFHPTKNGNLTPENIPANTSSKKYWWKCSVCGHEWKTGLNNRIKGTGCPKCKFNKIGKAHRKAIVQLDSQGNVIKRFDSISQAINETGFSTIQAVLRGKSKTAGGYYWKYVD